MYVYIFRVVKTVTKSNGKATSTVILVCMIVNCI